MKTPGEVVAMIKGMVINTPGGPSRIEAETYGEGRFVGVYASGAETDYAYGLLELAERREASRWRDPATELPEDTGDESSDLVEVAFDDSYGKLHPAFGRYDFEHGRWYDRRDQFIPGVRFWRPLGPLPALPAKAGAP